MENSYKWVEQSCPTCGEAPQKYLGRRGGAAHREGLGVESEIWQCIKCSLVFPNPMPVPVGDAEQHYGAAPDEYFEHHDSEEKLNGAKSRLEQAATLVGGAGKILDIGTGRGESVKAAKQLGWNAVGIETSPQFADYAEKSSGVQIMRKPLDECAFPDK